MGRSGLGPWLCTARGYRFNKALPYSKTQYWARYSGLSRYMSSGYKVIAISCLAFCFFMSLTNGHLSITPGIFLAADV
jgi:hypothetical protein